MPRKSIMMAAMIGSIGIGGIAFAAPPAADFVKMAGASDLYEEQSSKLVLASTKDPKIKAFANEMVRDHMKTTAGVKMGAKQSGMTPKPPMLDADQQQMMTALRGASGSERDQLYIQQQKTSHQQALALMTDYSQTGDDPALRKAASTALPIVQHHVSQLDSM